MWYSNLLKCFSQNARRLIVILVNQLKKLSYKGAYVGFSEQNPNTCDIEVYETIMNGDLAGDDFQVN